MIITGKSVRLMQTVQTNVKQVRISAGEVAVVILNAPRDQVVVQTTVRGRIVRALVDRSVVRTVENEA